MTKNTFSPEVITALATLREVARRNRSVTRVVDAINTLDNAGVFAALDEQTGYADAVEILAEAAAISLHDPELCTAGADASPALHAGTCPVWAAHHGLTQSRSAEWGDTTKADMAAHQASFDRRMSDELDAGDRAAMSRLARRALGLNENPLHLPGCRCGCGA